MQFYSPQILLLLVSRRSKHSKSQYLRSTKSNSKADDLDAEVALSRKTASDLMHSWLVMVPIRDILNTAVMNTSTDKEEVLKQTDTVASINMSEFITRTNVEALPWHAIKLTTNGDRSIIFVVSSLIFFYHIIIILFDFTGTVAVVFNFYGWGS
ncbi:unnamed protein product [Trichobilharzia regenti]|nr:unnamed protein product [Trichobilharzia regenti]